MQHVLLIIAMIAAKPAIAQPPASMPATVISTYARSAEIQALIARARREIRPDQALVQLPLLRFAPYTAFLEYRRDAWTAAYHPDVEMFYVVQGSGSFVLGGALVGEKPGADGNRSGSDIAGGVVQKVTAGDFFIAPKQTPHMFPKPDGELVLITIHVP